MSEMSTHSVRNRLDGLKFTAGLSAEQLDRLAEIATPVSWEPGRVIFSEGDRDANIYLVEDGRIAIEIAVPSLGKTTVLTVERGEMFGWSSLFYRRPKTATARALLPTSAQALDSGRLLALCDADPVLGYAITRRLLEVVSERLKATRIQLMDVFQS
jgi:CRP-like cAMP-binding protein